MKFSCLIFSDSGAAYAFIEFQDELDAEVLIQSAFIISKCFDYFL